MQAPVVIASLKIHKSSLSFTAATLLVLICLINMQQAQAKPAQEQAETAAPAATMVSGEQSKSEESKGAMLYENHCRSCHDSTAHIRDKRKAKNFGDIQYWVTRWSQHLKLKWTAEELNAVAEHVNKTYYQY